MEQKKANQMKLYLILMIMLVVNCFTKYPGDRYQSTSNYYTDEQFKKTSIYKLKVGVTSKKEVIEEFGKIYDNHLTFDPALKRRYKGKIYQVGYLVHYGYADYVVEKGQGYESSEIKENIQLTMFFDEKEVLLFYYISQNGGKMELHNIPADENEDSSFLWPGISCDFKYYESISNPIVGWRMGNMAEEKDPSVKCDWEKYIQENKK